MEIDHLGIAVTSLEESLRFYRDALGMEAGRRESIAAERVNVAMLAAGESGNAPRLELLEPTAAESPVGRFLAKRGPGLHHVALRVDDLAASVKRLQDSGATLLNEPRIGAGGHSYVFVHPKSTGGVLLELVQK